MEENVFNILVAWTGYMVPGEPSELPWGHPGICHNPWWGLYVFCLESGSIIADHCSAVSSNTVQELMWSLRKHQQEQGERVWRLRTCAGSMWAGSVWVGILYGRDPGEAPDRSCVWVRRLVTQLVLVWSAWCSLSGHLLSGWWHCQVSFIIYKPLF